MTRRGAPKLAWQPLKEWLAAYYPSDVPMPCPPGSKRPMFCHSSSPWHWDDLEFFAEHQAGSKPHDIGILLCRLCVVDVDSLAQCEELEARFPILCRVPCETTKKGRHYYFERSAKADRHGYFDGRAQLVKGVDFKTACRNGSAGFVVAAPSEGKEWVRPPWSAGGRLEPIPDDLLAAVASPLHWPVDANFLFPDGSSLAVEQNTWLARFACLAPLVAADDDGLMSHSLEAIPLPLGSADVLRELLWVCEHGRVWQWPTNLELLRTLADFLGVPAQVRRMLEPGNPAGLYGRLEALHAVSPTWARLTVHPGHLEDVTQHAGLAHEPLPRSSEWLFFRRDAAAPKPGVPLLRPDPLGHAQAVLPAPVLHMLLCHPNLLLAGGAALALASQCVGSGADYDLFLWGTSIDHAEAVRMELLAQPGVTAWSESGAALSIVWGPDDAVIQLITWRYESPEHVLDSFDLAPCKVALGCFGVPGGALQLRARRVWLESMRHLACWVDMGCWSNASVPRILKYYAKGLDLVVPGLVRTACRVSDPINLPRQHGISSLFKVEAMAECALRPRYKLAGKGADSARPAFPLLHSLLRKHCAPLFVDSAYAELIPPAAFASALLSCLRAGLSWLGLAQPKRRQAPPASSRWARAPVHGCLFPASPRFAAVFKVPA